jgi:8-oxo-dGTP pyrophosphatase MutT (NUDIX family)
MRGDGDGWVTCAAGHRHWGRYGAAGLLIMDGENAILQHRAPWTHEGGLWGIPGGARDSSESAVDAALREAFEEAALDPSHIEAAALSVNDHGGWSYTTVLARPLYPLAPHAANAESVEIRWWPIAQVDALPLHPGLAAHWPVLALGAPPLVLVVPSEQLGTAGVLATTGIPASAVPAEVLETSLNVLFPRVVDDAGAVDASEIGFVVDAAWVSRWAPPSSL